MKKKRIIFIVGPTAIGKSEIAANLAKKLNAEIISCDSMQIYKGMDIITSKAPLSLREKIPHHLIDILQANKEYDVSKYRRDALKGIKGIVSRRKTPIFVGGSGLYMSILVDGIFIQRPIDKKIRMRLYKLADKYGTLYLYKQLIKADPETASKIHPNDKKRIIRALEVFKGTHEPISILKRKRQGLRDAYDVKIFCLNMKRTGLYRKINQRVDKMFKEGIVGEAKRLLKKKLSKTASYAIGIRELKGYFDGLYDLEEARRLIKRNTRQYAKRQLSWFRKDKNIVWIEIGTDEKPVQTTNRILSLVTSE